MKKNMKVILIIFIILVIAIIGVGACFIMKNKQDSDKKVEELENQIAMMKENEISNNSMSYSNTDSTTNSVGSNDLNETNKIEVGNYVLHYGEYKMSGVDGIYGVINLQANNKAHINANGELDSEKKTEINKDVTYSIENKYEYKNEGSTEKEMVYFIVFHYDTNKDFTFSVEKDDSFGDQWHTYEFVNTSSNDENSTNAKTTVKNNTISGEKVLYTYSSGDNAAVNGNSKVLYIYEINENVIKFKYCTSLNSTEIEGIANKTNTNLYVYENGNKKIELLLNSMGENSIKVTEYENGNMSSFKNLWK